jgi:hypothetical protein
MAFACVSMLMQQAGFSSAKNMGKERAGNCISIILGLRQSPNGGLPNYPGCLKDWLKKRFI